VSLNEINFTHCIF